MATRSPAADEASTPSIAATLSDAAVVHAVVHADADALAAGGLLVRAAARRGIPYQLSVADTAAVARARIEAADGDTSVVPLGFRIGDAQLVDRPITEAVFADLAAAGDEPDAGLAVAGVRAIDAAPTATLSEAVEASPVERTPGVATPTTDLATGLAHTALVHGPFSGDGDAATALVDRADNEPRALASMVAIDATDEAPPEAATAVERLLRPHALPDGPTPTAEGLADLLGTVGRAAPGIAATIAATGTLPEGALEVWRTHGEAVHPAVADATLEARTDLAATATGADPWSVARLLRDFETTEPAVLVIGDRRIALATTDVDARTALDAAVAADATGHARLGVSPRPDEDAAAIVEAAEEAIA